MSDWRTSGEVGNYYSALLLEKLEQRSNEIWDKVFKD